MPLEGDEEGEGSFLGSICSKYSLGNLEASERTMKARRVKNRHLCLQEPNMLINTTEESLRFDPLTFEGIAALEALW